MPFTSMPNPPRLYNPALPYPSNLLVINRPGHTSPNGRPYATWPEANRAEGHVGEARAAARRTPRADQDVWPERVRACYVLVLDPT
jgi:hypothetical protein